MQTHPKSKIGHAQGFTKIRKHSKLRNSRVGKRLVKSENTTHNLANNVQIELV